MFASELNSEVLTANGIEQLNADRSPWMRAQTAASVAILFVEGSLNERERGFAIGILEMLARDLEIQVREALSEQVKHCAFLPRSIAQTLARDVESVALPIIRYSSVLEEADLAAIARDGGTAKQIAVSQRDNLAEAISGILVDTEKSTVIGALLANESARIDAASYGRILERLGQDDEIKALLVERPALPAAVVARMVLKISDSLRERLIERFGLPEDMVEDLTARACEQALSEAVGETATGESLETLSKRLHDEGALTPQFLLRALFTGQIRLFTAAIAARAGVSLGNADELIRDGGQRGIMALHVHAGLPGALMPAFRIALDIVREKDAQGPAVWRQSDTQRILSRLIFSYSNLAPGHLESILTQLGHLSTGSADAA